MEKLIFNNQIQSFIMKNKLFILFSFISLNIFAGGGSGGSLFPFQTTMSGTKPAGYPCTEWATGAGPAGPLTGAATNCNPGTCSPNWTNTYWERYVFKNTDLNPACYTISFAGTGGCNIVYAQLGTAAHSSALNWCPTTSGMFSPGVVCIGAGLSFAMTVPGCSEFAVVLYNNNGARGNYAVNVTKGGAPTSSVACSGTECIKTLTLGGSPVPTMTQWGLFLFGLIVLTLGVVAVFNMSRKSSNETAR